MKACRITFRFFAILLGLVGMILLTWLSYESYSLSQVARQSNQDFFSTVDRGLVNLDTKCSKLQTTFDKTVFQLDELEEKLRTSARKIVDNRVSQTVIETSQKVSVQIERAAGVMETASDLLEVALNIQHRRSTRSDESLKETTQTDEPVLWQDRVRKLQQQVRSILSSLQAMQQQLDIVQSEPIELIDRNDLVDRLVRIVGKVKSVRDTLAKVRSNLSALQVNLTDKRTAYDKLIGELWWVILCVALWMGLGQFCLMKYLFRSGEEPIQSQKSV